VVAEALAKSGPTDGALKSTPWEDPRTGARGTVTPLATAHNQDGLLCRDFLASYVHGGSESWLEGAACRLQERRWEVRTLKPWKRT
jgi:surface antigen